MDGGVTNGRVCISFIFCQDGSSSIFRQERVSQKLVKFRVNRSINQSIDQR